MIATATKKIKRFVLLMYVKYTIFMWKIEEWTARFKPKFFK